MNDNSAPDLYGTVNIDDSGEKKPGDWIQTRSGVRFHLLNPHPDDFAIGDIAHALSNICRFTGHVREFYSVAEHSVRVARYLDCWNRDTQYAGLMHDSAESYICDMARPFKNLPEFAFFRETEDRLMKVISRRFSFKYPLPDIVKMADEVLLGTEARDLMAPILDGWHFRHVPLQAKIRPWSPRKAKREFLSLYHKLRP